MLFHQLRFEQKVFWRSREAAVFIFIFPLLLYALLGSAYGNEKVWQSPYRNQADAQAYVAKGTHIGPRQVEYVKDACNYLYETYGRFPAHVDAFYAPGMWLQFSHLEMEYYDRFFDPTQYTRQAAHDGLWHP